MKPLNWEQIDAESMLYRAKVPLGWFIKQETTVEHRIWNPAQLLMDTYWNHDTNVFFLSDPEHTWDMLGLLSPDKD